MHLQLVNGLPTVERPRGESALGNPALVPRERYDHPGVVVPDANLLPVEVHPQSPCASPETERPHHGGLRLCHEVRGREERADPVGRLLVVADDLDVLVEEKGTPLLANTHGRVNRPPVNLIHSPEPIFVPIVVEAPLQSEINHR